jgi:undecaprenyl diphosphate synthase
MVAQERYFTAQSGAVAAANLEVERNPGLHVAIIMDGNGRWATARGLPRVAGHRAGAQAVRHATRRAAELGIATLTLFAFSSDNWRRPATETKALMRLLRVYLVREAATCRRRGIRLNVIGRRDRLAPELRELINRTEAATRDGDGLHLRIAIDYSARDSILHAVENLAAYGERSNAIESDDVNAMMRSSPPRR